MRSESEDDEATRLIERQWPELIQRFKALHSLFDDTQLGVTAEHAARHLGIADASALKNWLRARHLPPFKELRNWYYLVVMLERAERGEVIASWSLRQGKNPSVYYKFVESLGGGSWESWLARGSIDAKRRGLRLFGAFNVE